MLKVLFFGRLREQLGCGELTVDYGDDTADLDGLQRQLVAARGAAWGEALGADNIIRAVNHKVSDGKAALCDGDEVAFFPPVTGG